MLALMEQMMMLAAELMVRRRWFTFTMSITQRGWDSSTPLWIICKSNISFARISTTKCG